MSEPTIDINADIWWKQAVVYQIYPRSFADTTGSGLGDIRGISTKMDYLQALGVDAVWLSPFYPSELADGGYDVIDYRDVDPRLGTMDDFDEMTLRAHEAGIKVIVDIVPNHCSHMHPWFQQALDAPPARRNATGSFSARDAAKTANSRPPTGSTISAVRHGSEYLTANGTCTCSLSSNQTGTGTILRCAKIF